MGFSVVEFELAGFGNGRMAEWRLWVILTVRIWNLRRLFVLGVGGGRCIGCLLVGCLLVSLRGFCLLWSCLVYNGFLSLNLVSFCPMFKFWVSGAFDLFCLGYQKYTIHLHHQCPQRSSI